MLKLLRTTSSNPDFINLVGQLDADLEYRDGDDHEFYAQFNHIDIIKYTLVAYLNNKLVGCGAIKPFNAQSMEVKRMYTTPEFRGQGIAIKILNELESWTKELGFDSCVLETGKKQPEAIALYKKCGYIVISNYGQYAQIENSVCFRKQLN